MSDLTLEALLEARDLLNAPPEEVHCHCGHVKGYRQYLILTWGPERGKLYCFECLWKYADEHGVPELPEEDNAQASTKEA